MKNLYRNLSLKNKLILIFCSQSILLTLCYIFISVSSIEESQAQIDDSISKVNNALLYELSHQIDSLDLVTKFPVTDIYKGAENNLYSLLEKQDSSPEIRLKINTAFQLQAADTMLLHPSISQLYLFDVEGNLLSENTTHEYSALLETSFSDPWFQKALSANGQLVLLNKSLLPSATSSNYTEEYLFAARTIITLEQMKPVGVLLAAIECKNISNVFHQQRLYDSESFSIFIDHSQPLLGSTPLALSIKEIENAEINQNEVIHKVSKTHDDYYHIKYDRENHIYSIIHTPGDSIAPSLLSQILPLLLLLLLSIIAAALLSFYTFHNVLVSVNRLVDANAEIEKGNFSFRIPANTKDEFGYLMESFNTMSSKVETLINEIYEKNLSEKELEIQMLRNQINPHFLYNTLESMRMLAYSQGFPDFSEMCLLLAKLLRYGVDSTFHITTVKREIENLQDYICLINYRFHNTIQIVARISPDIYEYPIPKLLLQPLVENAVNHGINSPLRTGRITILGFFKDNLLYFKVTDNGSGIPRKKLDSLIKYINNENDDFSSIGLKNVHRRIQLFYGNQYGVSLESVENCGTSVSIIIPTKVPDGETNRNQEL